MDSGMSRRHFMRASAALTAASTAGRAAAESVVGDPEAEALTARPYRAPWRIEDCL